MDELFHYLTAFIFPPPPPPLVTQGSGGAEAQGTSHGASRGMAMQGGPPQGYITSGHQVTLGTYVRTHCSLNRINFWMVGVYIVCVVC